MLEYTWPTYLKCIINNWSFSCSTNNSPLGEVEWAIDPWPLRAKGQLANCFSITQLVGQEK